MPGHARVPQAKTEPRERRHKYRWIKGVAGYIPLGSIMGGGRPGLFEMLLGLGLLVGGIVGLVLPSRRSAYDGYQEANLSPDYTNELTAAPTLEFGATGDIVSGLCVLMGIVFVLIALKKITAARRFARVAASTDRDVAGL